MKKILWLSIITLATSGINAMEGKYEEAEPRRFTVTINNETNKTIKIFDVLQLKEVKQIHQLKALALIEPTNTQTIEEREKSKAQAIASFLINEEEENLGLLTIDNKNPNSLTAALKIKGFPLKSLIFKFDPMMPEDYVRILITLAGDNLSESSVKIDTSEETDFPEEEEEEN